MRTSLAVSVLLILMPVGEVWSQGHPEASGEASIKIERSSEYSAKGREYEQEVPVELKYHEDGCAATLSLRYYQKNTHAHVTSTISNTQCAASSGTYELRIRYRTDDGEQGELTFDENWSRDNDADVVIEKDYFVGENLEVRRASTSNLTCTCTVADETGAGGE